MFARFVLLAIVALVALLGYVFAEEAAVVVDKIKLRADLEAVIAKHKLDTIRAARSEDLVYVDDVLSPLLSTTAGLPQGLLERFVREDNGALNEAKFLTLLESLVEGFNEREQLTRVIFSAFAGSMMADPNVHPFIKENFHIEPVAAALDSRLKSFLPPFSKALFRLLDEDGNGLISQHELHIIDVDGSGKITPTEINSIVAGIKAQDPFISIPAIFRIVDDNKNSQLEATEIVDFIKDLLFVFTDFFVAVFDIVEKDLETTLKAQMLQLAAASELLPLSFETAKTKANLAEFIANKNQYFFLDIFTIGESKLTTEPALAEFSKTVFTYVSGIEQAIKASPAGHVSLSVIADTLLDLTATVEESMKQKQEEIVGDLITLYKQQDTTGQAAFVRIAEKVSKEMLAAVWRISSHEAVKRVHKNLWLKLLQLLDSNHDNNLSLVELRGLYDTIKLIDAEPANEANYVVLLKLAFDIFDPSNDDSVSVEDLGLIWEEVNDVLIAALHTVVETAKAVFSESALIIVSTALEEKKRLVGGGDAALTRFELLSLFALAGMAHERKSTSGTLDMN